MHPEEAAFNAALDSDPSDHTARLVYADWLEERGDERAEGYRALARLQKTPLYCNGDFRAWWYCVCGPGEQSNILGGGWWTHWKREIGYDRREFTIDCRREAEDAAARAFAKLPAACRAELLKPATPVEV